jgi:hypothetical protein
MQDLITLDDPHNRQPMQRLSNPNAQTYKDGMRVSLGLLGNQLMHMVSRKRVIKPFRRAVEFRAKPEI